MLVAGKKMAIEAVLKYIPVVHKKLVLKVVDILVVIHRMDIVEKDVIDVEKLGVQFQGTAHV